MGTNRCEPSGPCTNRCEPFSGPCVQFEDFVLCIRRIFEVYLAVYMHFTDRHHPDYIDTECQLLEPDSSKVLILHTEGFHTVSACAAPMKIS